MRSQKGLEYSFKGLLTVRVVNNSGRDLRLLPGLSSSAGRDPEQVADLEVTFVDSIGKKPVVFGNDPRVGFADYDEIVLHDRSTGKRVCFDLRKLGTQGFKLIVERKISQIPYVKVLLSLSCLLKGAVSLHASAVSVGGRTLALSGWERCGKTTGLIALCVEGATYLSDDWVLLGKSCGLVGNRGCLDLSARQVRFLIEKGIKFGLTARLGLIVNALIVEVERLALASGRRTMAKLAGKAYNRQSFSFDPASCFTCGRDQGAAGLDQLFLLVGQESYSPSVERVARRTMIDRLTLIQRKEWAPLWSIYDDYRFLFPGVTISVIENLKEAERKAFLNLLSETQCYLLKHPYPTDARLLKDLVIDTAESLRELN